jgi:tetratricopeptide (TPR) repeat protein
MLRCHSLLLGMLLATGVFFGGCATGSRKTAAEPKSAAKASRSAKDVDEATLKKRAEAHAHYAAGVIDEINNQTEAASKQFLEAALADPDNEELTIGVSRRFLQANQTQKALQLLTNSAARPNASGLVHAQLGFVYSRLGKSDLAIAANRVAIKKMPLLLAGYQNLALNYFQGKQPDEAFAVLDEAAKVSNADAEFLIGLADLYANFSLQSSAHKTNAMAKAASVLQRAEKLKPSSPAVRLKLADSLNIIGEDEKAAVLYNDVLKQLPESSALREVVRAKLTEVFLRSSNRSRAVEQLKSILKDDPTNVPVYYTLGALEVEDKKYADAADRFSKVILLKPEFEQAYYDLASVQLDLNKADNALATLENARRKFTPNFVMEFLSGMAHMRRKDYTNAIQHLTSAEVIAKATDPKRLTPGFYFQLGAASERKGDIEQAEKHFEKCLELSPDFAEAQNYLGYMWAERGTNLDRARELIEKAVKSEPKNAAFLDSMGWVLFKLEQPKDALDYILKAIEHSEEPDATVYDHLGDIYAALRESAKAQEAWRKSLSIEANEQVRKKLNP